LVVAFPPSQGEVVHASPFCCWIDLHPIVLDENFVSHLPKQSKRENSNEVVYHKEEDKLQNSRRLVSRKPASFGSSEDDISPCNYGNNHVGCRKLASILDDVDHLDNELSQIFKYHQKGLLTGVRQFFHLQILCI